jgi:hypothetical protein
MSTRKVILNMTDAQIEALRDWTEIAAVRLEDTPDGNLLLRMTTDLDRITRPENA